MQPAGQHAWPPAGRLGYLGGRSKLLGNLYPVQPEKALDILARKNKSEGSDDEPLGKLPNLNKETPEAQKKADAVPQQFAQIEILSPSKFNVPVIEPEIAPTPEKVQYFAPHLPVPLQ
jgi:hypothetical protein